MKTENVRTVTLDTVIDLPALPSAALFNMLPESTAGLKHGGLTLAELADSIIKHGLMEPLVLFNGQLLDGRNRRAACILAAEATEVPFSEFLIQVEDFVGTEEEADEYVKVLNLARRDLDAGQRAFIAVGFWELEAKRAKERQGARTDIDNIPSNLTEGWKDTRDVLAQEFNVSNSYIDLARKQNEKIDQKQNSAEFQVAEAQRQAEIAEEARRQAEAEIDASRRADLAAKANAATAARRAAEEKAREEAAEAARLRAAKNRVIQGEQAMYTAFIKEDPGQITNDKDPLEKAYDEFNSQVILKGKAKIKEILQAGGDVETLHEKVAILVQWIDFSFKYMNGGDVGDGS